MNGATRRADVERQAVERERQWARAHVGGPVNRVRDRALRRRRHLGTTAIIDIDHADRPFGQQLEQPSLGDEIRLHVAMEVQVVAREVREDARGETKIVDAAQ